MDNSVVSLISNVGFPIAAFLLMFRLTTKTIKENTEALKQLKESVIKLKGGVKK